MERVFDDEYAELIAGADRADPGRAVWQGSLFGDAEPAVAPTIPGRRRHAASTPPPGSTTHPAG
ncbi:MAG: hypothetical protein U5R31_07790 [Acidimicrobiia bacterium]|nr:hypothetical protein [Acidimicrobiia bacterium]